MNEFFKYGEKVEGYDVRVVNEREARAAAGILFAIGILSLMNATMLGHVVVTKFFISFFTLDFLLRVINPSYSPSLLLGRVFVQNQIPEYVGAAQKRFAWSIGLVLAVPMFYLLVIDFQPNPIKVFICILCLILLIAESAFSICLGCKIYNFVMSSRATHCPGGVCEIVKKDKIQTFNPVQILIVILVLIAFSSGLYAYFTKVESKTFLAKKIKMMTLSDAELQAIKDAKLEAEAAEFFADDDF
ncbi:DUF4395 domain-containing protein [Sulfurimonas sp. CS5]|jgi:hypothetical protein|uniref:DUF4395 domain-containing protein n=1 Tax=Sulfurimonas sp. CS5 TaxID=3391145 RepID=UPI0039EA869D